MTADERKHLRKLLAEASPRPWLRPFNDGAICSSASPSASLLALDIDGMAIVDQKTDTALIVEGVNALGALLDELDASDEACLAIDDLLEVIVQQSDALAWARAQLSAEDQAALDLLLRSPA